MSQHPARPLVSVVAKIASLAAVLSAAVTPAMAVTIPVTTSADEQPTPNGDCTLREALAAAESNVVVDACPAGSAVEPDVILLLDTAHAWNAGAAFVAGGGPLILRGPSPPQKGCYVIIDPPFALRFLQLLNGADVTIENVEIREGDASTDQSFPAGGAILASNVVGLRLTLRNVTLRLNRARTGGALYVSTSSACVGCRITIERSLVSENVAEVDDGPYNVLGGGVVLKLRGDTSGRIVDSAFEWNAAASSFAANQPRGGGIYVDLSDAATLEIRRSRIYANSAVAGVGATATAGGASIWPFGDGMLTLEDVRLEGNQVVGPAAGNVSVTALEVHTGFSGSFELDRVFVYGNDWSEDGVDLYLQHATPTPASARNVLVAAGARRGASVVNLGPGPIQLAHWTVTQHVDNGLHIVRDIGTGVVRLDNSILWQNGTDLTTFGTPTIDPVDNLIGVDPIFEAPGLGGFRLHPSSPAIDLGDPTHSGSAYDVVHAPRAVGVAPDVGAFERGGLFGDGFESGDTGAWSDAVP